MPAQVSDLASINCLCFHISTILHCQRVVECMQEIDLLSDKHILIDQRTSLCNKIISLGFDWRKFAHWFFLRGSWSEGELVIIRWDRSCVRCERSMAHLGLRSWLLEARLVKYHHWRALWGRRFAARCRCVFWWLFIDRFSRTLPFLFAWFD